ncbi:hypothetical protein QJS10_CPB20g00481 [Acorus calamus]|uniref:BED-type domain-containing protein n=1 Tax=Acorus calamus TaxID=4465 RepID=A0AAV9CAZ4_ACOCL|nr:hypothetical protein QJS10_CPB20g00481 [Acorus calamus]
MMPRNRDPLWEHVELKDGKVACSFCRKTFNGGITRIRHHLAKSDSEGISKCPDVSAEVHEMARKVVQQMRNEKGKKEFISDDRMALTKSSSRSHTQLDPLSTQKSVKLKANMSFGSTYHLMYYDPKFKEMCAAIADAEQGYEPPSFEMDKTKILGDMETEVDGYVQSIKKSWEKFGCTLILDLCCEDDKSYLCLFAACPKGVVNLGSRKNHYMDDNEVILDFVSSVIDEMGPQNILQIILNDPHFCSVGVKVEQKETNFIEEANMEDKVMNRPVIKTIKSPDGDIIDCVDIYKQPAFDHPLLRNHTIQMGPLSYPKGFEPAKNTMKSKLHQPWHLNGTCPEGTIPIRRTQKSDLIRKSPGGHLGGRRPHDGHEYLHFIQLASRGGLPIIES